MGGDRGSPIIKYRRYRTMEGAANRLQKEAKGYLDSLRGRSSVSPFSALPPVSALRIPRRQGGGVREVKRREEKRN